MNIRQKIKNNRKTYAMGDPHQKTLIENMLRKEIDADPDKDALWASLVMDGEIGYPTFEQRRASKLASKVGVIMYLITKDGIEYF